MASVFINVDVPDLEQGIRFYTTAFDLSLSRRLGAGFVELLGAQAPIYLVENVGGSPPFPNALVRRDYGRHWTPVHLDFVVDDLDAALSRALTAGATQERAPTEHAYGRLALLCDPFGHGVCLLQLSARGYDAIAQHA